MKIEDKDLFTKIVNNHEEKRKLKNSLEKTQVWRAIYRYISDYNDNRKECVFFTLDEDYFIPSYRGTGLPIHIKNVTPACNTGMYDAVKVEVTTEYLESGQIIEYHIPTEFSFDITIPSYLFTNFTDGDFVGWLLSLKILKEEDKHKKNKETLQRLILEYPEFAQQFFKRI